MLTVQHQEEGLSAAFLTAIAAKAGILLELKSAQVDYGVDASIQEVVKYGNKLRGSGHRIDVQMKSSVKWSVSGGEVVYDMEAHAYNDLVHRCLEPRAAPLIVMLLCLPPDAKQWLSCTPKQMVARHCCYWFHTKGPHTKNTATQRVRIPTNQLVTPDNLKNLLTRLNAGTFP